MDVFIEHRVVKKLSSADKGKMLLLGLAAVLLFILLFWLGLNIQQVIPLCLIAEVGLVYGIWYVFSSFSVEYEYALTNGDLDVDKIIAKRKRKRLITINIRGCELCAPVHSEKYKRELNNTNFRTKIDASSSPSSPHAYFIVCQHPTYGLTRLIFEPDDRMLKACHTAAPRKVFEQ